MKKNILTTLVAALVYFLCIGVGVLLGSLVDHTGNMFYATRVVKIFFFINSPSYI